MSGNISGFIISQRDEKYNVPIPFVSPSFLAVYIQNWLKVLKGDKRFIVSAAGMVEKAVHLILNQ